jgi:arylsulfatase A-like enzyme
VIATNDPLEAGASPTTAARPGPREVLLWSAWFGMVAGYFELAAFLAKCNLLDPRNYNASRHFVWMYPIAGLAIVGVPGSLLALASLVRPGRLPAAVVVGVLTFVAALGVLFRGPISTVACLLLACGIGVQAGRYFGARAATFHRWVRRSLPVLFVLIAATAAVSHGRGVWIGQRARAGLPRPPSGSKNVLLIVLDTVRADSLSLYGYPRETAPNLTRMAARGVRFDRAFATAPWTAPSHASMFTGRWANELSVGWNKPLDATSPTLAEFLGGLGYDTAGFVANSTYCSYETGLDRGFARYDDYDVTPRAILLCSALVQRTLNSINTHPRLARWLDGGGSSAPFRKSAARINGDFLEWESRRGREGRPFFAFLNYYDAHHPYLTPEPWEGGPPGRRPESAADFGLLRSWWGLDKRRLDDRQVELARDSYESCIAYLDGQLGRLFDELDRRGLLRDTILVVTADHGEHLGEQRLYGHGVSLYRTELHVPLIVLGPDGLVPKGQVVRAPVSLRDLAATVVDRSGVAPETSPFPGRSLARAWSRNPVPVPDAAGELIRSELEAPPEDDPNRGESPARRGSMTSLVRGGLHYIRNGDGREELYDLDSDSGEEHDLAAAPGFDRALRGFRERLRR